MMKAEAVNGWRASVASSIRVAAIVLLAWGGALVVKKVAFGIGTAQPEMIWNVYEGVGEEHGTYRGIAYLAVGVVLAFAANWLARWAIRPPAEGCPSCGYERWESRCPECGLERGGGAAHVALKPAGDAGESAKT